MTVKSHTLIMTMKGKETERSAFKFVHGLLNHSGPIGGIRIKTASVQNSVGPSSEGAMVIEFTTKEVPDVADTKP